VLAARPTEMRQPLTAVQHTRWRRELIGHPELLAIAALPCMLQTLRARTLGMHLGRWAPPVVAPNSTQAALLTIPRG
jgi:hypothetical protein